MSTIGFVGLGSMGAPIAGRLLQGNAAIRLATACFTAVT